MPGRVSCLQVLLKLPDRECPGKLHEALAGLSGRSAPILTEIRFPYLTVTAPEGDDPDRFLARLGRILDKINAAPGGFPRGIEIIENRMTPMFPPDAAEKTGRVCGRFKLVSETGGADTGRHDRIMIKSGHVFGSGHHPSTRLAVSALEDIDTPGGQFPERVLDVGTGSGILALVSVRLGARRVLGVDVSPDAVAIARRNVEANGLSGRIMIDSTPVDEIRQTFDLIIANLTASVLVRQMDHFAGLLGPAGILIISGLMGRQADDLRKLAETGGLQTIKEYGDGKWRALRLAPVYGNQSPGKEQSEIIKKIS